MSRSKLMRGYPMQFLSLLDALNNKPEVTVDIPFDTMEEAKSFRLDFNSFRAAALREGLETSYPQMLAIYVQCLDKPVRARFSNKDFGSIAKKIELALAKTLQE